MSPISATVLSAVSPLTFSVYILQGVSVVPGVLLGCAFFLCWSTGAGLWMGWNMGQVEQPSSVFALLLCLSGATWLGSACVPLVSISSGSSRLPLSEPKLLWMGIPVSCAGGGGLLWCGFGTGSVTVGARFGGGFWIHPSRVRWFWGAGFRGPLSLVVPAALAVGWAVWARGLVRVFCFAASAYVILVLLCCCDIGPSCGLSTPFWSSGMAAGLCLPLSVSPASALIRGW